MKSKLVPVVALSVCSFARAASAEDRVSSSRESIEHTVEQAPRQHRRVHADYGALSAGAVLFGLGYAIALSVPVRKNFGEDSGRFALPLVGPWLTNPSWGWALDGLVQLGGAAFMVDAYVNPITVLGTPEERRMPSATAQHSLRMTIRF